MAEVRDQIEKSMAAAEKRGNESFSIPSLGATVGDSLQEMVLQDYREAGWTVSMEGCGNERYITFE